MRKIFQIKDGSIADFLIIIIFNVTVYRLRLLVETSLLDKFVKKCSFSK